MNPYRAALEASNPHILAAQWEEPIYFSADDKTPKTYRNSPETAAIPFWGSVPSLYLGDHVGWIIGGIRYPREVFREWHPKGCFTGGHPVGLTPLQPLS